MKLDHFGVSPSKVEALIERIRKLDIDPGLIEESSAKGGGPGGQKINKTANAVRLCYPPLDVSVRCQRERAKSVNRFLALRELVDEVEMRISPATSPRLKDWERLKKRKARKRSRSAAKYGKVMSDES